MTSDADDAPLDAFRLTSEESLVLVAAQALMIKRDVQGTRGEKQLRQKRQTQMEFRRGIAQGVSALAAGAEPSPWYAIDVGTPGWPQRVAASYLDLPAADRAHELEDEQFIADMAAASSLNRARSLVLLIELATFEPWPKGAGWSPKVNAVTLRALADRLPGTSAKDADRVTHEVNAAVRRIRKSSTNWGRLALLAAGGTALGVLTGGLAAPFIGAAVGASMGLAGAAATSAGLAALGGGSLAAGGFGMAGGSALLAALGGVASAGAAGVGGRLSGWTAGEVAISLVKLEVLTKLVLLDEQGDEATARVVVQRMQVRINELRILVTQVEQRVADLQAEVKAAHSRNDDLKDRLEQARREAAEANLKLKAFEVSSRELRPLVGDWPPAIEGRS